MGRKQDRKILAAWAYLQPIVFERSQKIKETLPLMACRIHPGFKVSKALNCVQVFCKVHQWHHVGTILRAKSLHHVTIIDAHLWKGQ